MFQKLKQALQEIEETESPTEKAAKLILLQRELADLHNQIPEMINTLLGEKRVN